MRASGLRHEALEHAMKRDTVVELLSDEFLDALDVAGGEVRAQLDDDRTLGGVERQRVLSVGHRMS